MDSLLTSRVGFALRQAQHRLRSLSDDALRPYGLTTPQFAALKALAEHGDMSGASLARLGLVTPQTVHAILINLKDRRLVERIPSPTDARIMYVRLTEEGQALAAKVDPVVERAEAELTQNLTEADIEQLRLLLLACMPKRSSQTD